MKHLDAERTQPVSTRTLDRGLRILDFLKDRGASSLTEIASELELDKSTVHRLLGTLTSRLYVERSNDGRYRLTVGLIEHARRVTADSELYRIALPYLQRMRDSTRESANLGVIHGGMVVWLAVLEGESPLRVATPTGLGAGWPHCSATGKAVLAYLPDGGVEQIVRTTGLPARTSNTIRTMDALLTELQRIRERGYAIDDIENTPGLRCVATPIFGPDAVVLGAISISAPAMRFSLESAESLAPMLVQMSLDISRSMGAGESTLLGFWTATYRDASAEGLRLTRP